jgi:hypothetical protein
MLASELLRRPAPKRRVHDLPALTGIAPPRETAPPHFPIQGLSKTGRTFVQNALSQFHKKFAAAASDNQTGPSL